MYVLWAPENVYKFLNLTILIHPTNIKICCFEQYHSEIKNLFNINKKDLRKLFSVQDGTVVF